MMLRVLALTLAVSLLAVDARGIIFASTDDPTFNSTEPSGDYADSGWQFEGGWNGLLGTAIAPEYFITANHIGGTLGDSFKFQGGSYVTDATYAIDGTDLRLWHVTSTLPIYAPLYRKDDEVGKDLVVFGKGTERGPEVVLAGGVHGWLWGPADGVMRWGTNTVATAGDNAPYGQLISATFTPGATPFEAHLSVGDSSGGVFIKDDDGVWKLAGVNFAVDGPYYTSVLGDGEFNAALYDQTGYFQHDKTVYVPSIGPGSFYASRISTNAAAIDAIAHAPEPTALSVFACGIGVLGGIARRRRGA